MNTTDTKTNVLISIYAHAFCVYSILPKSLSFYRFLEKRIQNEISLFHFLWKFSLEFPSVMPFSITAITDPLALMVYVQFYYLRFWDRMNTVLQSRWAIQMIGTCLFAISKD
jgi:hypothetical protein